MTKDYKFINNLHTIIIVIVTITSLACLIVLKEEISNIKSWF